MRKISSVIIPVLFLFVFNNASAQADAKAGEDLFKANCASCHMKKLEKDGTGPALKGLLDKRDRKWAKDWIKDNAALIAAGDSLAIEVEKVKPFPMPPFTHLDDAQIENILEFIKEYGAAPAGGASSGGGAGDYAAGEKLFKSNCASCHNMKKKMAGPALLGVGDRVPSTAWLKSWIKSNSELRGSGDAYANKIYNEYGGAIMTEFAWMSDAELDNVVNYITNYKESAGPVDAGGSGGLIDCEVAVVEEESNLVIWLGVIGLALLIIAVFSGINRSLRNAAAIKNGETPSEPSSFIEVIKAYSKSHKIKFGFMVLAIVLTLAKIGWEAALHIGVYGGNGYEHTEDYDNYKPEQPIAFRHDIHVKQNNIDCKYCHSGVLESRHALIPSANVCMNCHKAVDEGHCTGDSEIGKIYEATGWDPDKQKYMHADGKYYDEPRTDKPIEWVKVHNLQDFVYFNHSQHIVVGGLECEQCHGDVGSMTTAEHTAPLTMGWCIKCHREQGINEELKFSGKKNGYYEKMHSEFKESWKHESEFDFTVEKIGGLECAKCHY